MEKYDYLIVGAGLFGATFSYLAKKAGKKCLVIDQRNHIGGNLYCKEIDGITVHIYGPHIFHTNRKDVYDFVASMVDFHPYCHQVIASYSKEIYALPFNMNTFYQMWGVKTAQEAKKIIRQQSKNILQPTTLEEKAISMVGTDIYQKLIKGYTEKQWGKECSELPPFIIERIPLRFTFDNRYFNDEYEIIPDKGYNSLFQKLLEGIDVKTNFPFANVKKTWKSLANKLLFTGRIDSLFNYKYGELPYRSLRFEHKCKPVDNYQACAVVNHTSSDVPFTRSVEHRFFEPHSDAFSKTIVTFEYPNGNASKESDDAFYPINTKENSEVFDKYRKELNNHKDVLVGGRLGNYQYYDMDDTIIAAMKLANEELKR